MPRKREEGLSHSLLSLFFFSFVVSFPHSVLLFPSSIISGIKTPRHSLVACPQHLTLKVTPIRWSSRLWTALSEASWGDLMGFILHDPIWNYYPKSDFAAEYLIFCIICPRSYRFKSNRIAAVYQKYHWVDLVIFIAWEMCTFFIVLL